MNSSRNLSRTDRLHTDRLHTNRLHTNRLHSTNRLPSSNVDDTTHTSSNPPEYHNDTNDVVDIMNNATKEIVSSLEFYDFWSSIKSGVVAASTLALAYLWSKYQTKWSIFEHVPIWLQLVGVFFITALLGIVSTWIVYSVRKRWHQRTLEHEKQQMTNHSSHTVMSDARMSARMSDAHDRE